MTRRTRRSPATDRRHPAMLDERYFPPLPHLWNGYLVVDAGGHGDGCLVELQVVPPYGVQGSPSRTLCGYGWGRPSRLVEPECSVCARRVLGEAVVASGDYSAHDEYPSDDPRRDDDEDIYGPWNDVR